MPHELHDANYMFQAANQLVDLRRQVSTSQYIDSPRKYAIKQGKKIHDLQWIYGLYGALDGLSGSFSMLKYFFDVYYANSGLSSLNVADEVHDWMMTPVGILVVGLEATVMVGVSIIANQFSGMKRLKAEEMKTADHWPYIKQRIVEDWPYIRDSMKALKNGYKGVRNVFVFANLLGVGRDLRYMVMPAGLVLGGLSAYNRPWLRKMRFERDSRVKENRKWCATLLGPINNQRAPEVGKTPQSELNAWIQFREEIAAQEEQSAQTKFEKQSRSESFSFCAGIGNWTGLIDDQPKYQSFWVYAYLSAAFNGLLDAPYLYLGVVSLTVISPSLWIFAAAGLFSVICVVTRLYEEHNLQREFLVTQLAVKSALSIRQFTGLLSELKIISQALLANNLMPEEREHLIALKATVLGLLQAKMADLQGCRDALKEQSVLSVWSLVLCGLKNGVEAFGVVASLMFAVASIYSMTMTAYPPVLLAFFIASGVACLALYVADALLDHFEHWKEMSAAEAVHGVSIVDDVPALITEMCSKCDSNEIEDQFNTINDTIRGKMGVIPSRQHFYQYWFEVPRLLYSGVGKGIRIVDSILVSWQALGADGHYHDTENMMLIAKVSAVILSIVFALRGFANASEKYCKQNPRDAPVLGEESAPPTDPDAPPSPSGRSRGTSSPTIPSPWFSFFAQNTPSMPPSMRSMNTLVPTL